MPSTMQTQLFDLPDVILQRIAEFLDEEPFYSFALAHPRLQVSCRDVVCLRRIRYRNIDDTLIQFVTLKASEVRALDLNNCWLSSESIKSLCKQCLNAVELNVMNSSLTLEDLLIVLNDLNSLEQLSVTITGVDEHTHPGLYPTIKKISIEVRPDVINTRFVIELLKSCPNAKFLHLIVFGRVTDDPISADNLSCGGESLEKYERVIISTDIGCLWTFTEAFRLIFKEHATLSSYLQSITNYYYFSLNRLFWFERETPTEEHRRLRPAPGTLSSLYRIVDIDLYVQPIQHHVRNQPPLALRVQSCRQFGDFEIPRAAELSLVKAVDLTQHHDFCSETLWRDLAASMPAIETLALPTCVLNTHEIVTGELTRDYFTGEFFESSLKNLCDLKKLKKLHIDSKSSTTSNYARMNMQRCSCKTELYDVLTNQLGDLRNLEELSLDDVILRRDYFNSPPQGLLPMRTVRLKVDKLIDIDGLIRFLRACTNLQCLKLEAKRAHLHFGSLLEFLSATNLKQLCLSMPGLGSLDPEIFPLQLFESLDLLHVHVFSLAEAEKLRAAFEEKERLENLKRKPSPVHFIVLEVDPFTSCEDSGLKFPGRSFCSLRSFIAEPEPPVWKDDRSHESEFRRHRMRSPFQPTDARINA